ncbi:MAG: hypothetical protein WDZ73_01545 [Candidatus Paceibacterota bacterium]
MIFLVLVCGGAYFWWYKTTNPALDNIGEAEIKREILNINFNSNLKRLEVEAVKVDKVSIFGSREGVEVKVGDLVKEAENLWYLELPIEPIAISKVWAIAYDEEGLIVEQKVFASEGLDLLKNLFWPEKDAVDYELKVGQSFSVSDDNVTIKLIDIPQDNRCPIGVECVLAGAATVDLEITAHDKTQIFSLKSDEGQRNIGGDYLLSIKTVAPDRQEGQTLSIIDYDITFTVSKVVQ